MDDGMTMDKPTMDDGKSRRLAARGASTGLMAGSCCGHGDSVSAGGHDYLALFGIINSFFASSWLEHPAGGYAQWMENGKWK